MVPPPQIQTATALWRTFGARGIALRLAYEAASRSGRTRRAEVRWLAHPAPTGLRLRPMGLADAATPRGYENGGPYRLYGGLDLTEPPGADTAWHVHPFTGHQYPPGSHWSQISDHDVESGDIKDGWELGRMGFLVPLGRMARAGTDPDASEAAWAAIESWHAANPPYCGIHWMSGQEVALRGLAVVTVADLLDHDPATTTARRELVAHLVQDAVGRVAATLGYARSQRNNHATSEAGFLWGATVLAPWLPDADSLRSRAARALTEAVRDQVAADGSFAQHSPTYHRLALQVLLWCLAVERATGAPVADGVTDAVTRSIRHLRALVVPDSEGRMPNMGGNDGALLFDLAGAPITDFRPLLAHASAAVGEPSGLEPGPWDAEAAWFGLDRVEGSPPPAPATINTHALTRPGTHVVVRGGPLRHRPAHADQLHVDVWLDGWAVAVDAGTYRYTAPDPWGNALAGDDVHNVPRRLDCPQAVRSGRFFWRRWSDAVVLDRPRSATGAAEGLLLELVLPDGTRLRRLVVVLAGAAVVVDDTSGRDVEVRWNLPAGVAVRGATGRTEVAGDGWSARLAHVGPAVVPEPTDQDPGSGWVAPTYAVREPCQAVLVRSGRTGTVVSAFASSDGGPGIDALVAWGESVRLDQPESLHLDDLPRPAISGVTGEA